ncbi:hypothetical protein EJ04DRAFT_558065 [Polyplosphaeria fusca]|uniref:SAP domain-containing protein n=1 Tax=Polyplosphaeria fusca TaxID=682080 RepID=A0A9P4RC05_9PLEO|nr:hypothetical protein EJ04DRAFT_558065 [Polyplosphaeria fusca]
MSDYGKMKNAELEALLKTRGLPIGGRKADMVERLTKDDEKNASSSKQTAMHPEDEIDWDDDVDVPAAKTTAADVSEAVAEPATSTTTASATTAAGGEGPVANPQAVPNQKAAIDPSRTDDLAVKTPAEQKHDAVETKTEESTEAPANDYSSGLAASNLEEEIEKRKARAKKFGLNIEDDEGLKKLERMKKFGETGPPKGLDEALPERRKRGHEGGGDDNLRQKRRGGRPGGGRRGDHRADNRGDNRGGDTRRDNRSNRSNNGGPSWMNETDRQKAEARKNRFGGSTAA